MPTAAQSSGVTAPSLEVGSFLSFSLGFTLHTTDWLLESFLLSYCLFAHINRYYPVTYFALLNYHSGYQTIFDRKGFYVD